MSADVATEVRLAQTEADRDAVFAVRRQVFVDEQSVPEELEYDELDMMADHFLALLGGVPAGAGRLVVIGSAPDPGLGQGAKATGILGRLAVGKAARGMGLGKLLVKAIEQRAGAGSPPSNCMRRSTLAASTSSSATPPTATCSPRPGSSTSACARNCRNRSIRPGLPVHGRTPTSVRHRAAIPAAGLPSQSGGYRASPLSGGDPRLSPPLPKCLAQPGASRGSAAPPGQGTGRPLTQA